MWLIASGLVILSCILVIETMPPRPNVYWAAATAESVDMDGERLDRLEQTLRERQSTAILIARSGHLVREWYASNGGPNHRYSLAAAAKGIVGSMLVLASFDDEYVTLDDLASDYIPDWKKKPMRSRITLRQLASHQSGMEDLWGGDYQRLRGDRFRMALEEASIDFEPGTRQRYSGTAFYPLSLALSEALQETPHPDLRDFLDARIMDPLEIPPEAWNISYSESYQQGGLTLYAIGSGASYTARAVARVSQLILDQGRWNGRKLLSHESLEALVTVGPDPPERIGEEPEPPANLGWWLNIERFSPSLPCDSIVAL